MSLNQTIHFLDSGHPVLWVATQDRFYLIDRVVENTTQKVYLLDAINGFMSYNREKAAWEKVLVTFPDGEQAGTNDFAVSLGHLMADGGVFISMSDGIIPQMASLLSSLYWHWRNGVVGIKTPGNDAKFVFVMTPDTDIPPPIADYTAQIKMGFMNAEEVRKFYNDTHPDLSSEELDSLVVAASGLTEAELIQSTISSIRDRNCIDDKYIADFKIDKIKNNGILEIRRPTMSLNEIGGMENAKEILQSIVWTWENPELSTQYGVSPIRKLMMVGVPGSGKSAICEATAATLQLQLAKFGVSQMMDKYVGQSEQNMRAAWAQVKAMAPIVLWADEIGRDLAGSGQGGDSGTTERTHGEFLTGMQELQDDVLFMAAANRIDGIPPEMFRADRFDKIMFVGFPTLSERMDIFKIHLGPGWDFFNIEHLAEVSVGFTGAEIKALIKETRFHVVPKEHRAITTEDILTYIPKARNLVWRKNKDDMVQMYARAITDWDWASDDQYREASYYANGQLPTLSKTTQAAQKVMRF